MDPADANALAPSSVDSVVHELHAEIRRLERELRAREAHISHFQMNLAGLRAELQCPLCRDTLLSPHRLRACGHVFCFTCLVRRFEAAMAEEPWWFWCPQPQCGAPIFVPPTPDERVEAAVRWLQLAEGDQLLDTPAVSLGAFDIYFYM